MHFVKHVIVGRDDVKEILDDAHVIIDSSLVRRNSNPRTSHASHIIWNNLVDFVPNTSVMTTSVASKRKHRKPRLKHWSMKAETLGDLLFESFIFQVPVVHIHATHWEKFRLSSYLVWVGVKFSNAKEEELLINDASQIGSKKFDFSIE